MVARLAIAPAAVHAFGQVESNRRAAAPQLPSQVSVLDLDALERRLKLLQDLENDGINTQHVPFPARNRARPPPATRARASRVQADWERQRPVTAAQRPLRPGGGSPEQAN
jgi:hypothetical protein